MGERLKIGEFASLTRVSVKALRFYEAQGLLLPDYVDPATGYRYFRLEQCADLALVTNLRSAGFSISEIGQLIESGLTTESVLDLVDAKRTDLRREKAELDGKLAVLEALTRCVSGAKTDPLSAVKLTSSPAHRVYAVARTVPHLGDPVSEIFESAEADVARANARAPSAPFLIFHDPPSKLRDLAVEVCIPLSDDSEGRIEQTIVSPCPLACSVVYSGAYHQTEGLRESMLEWVHEAGLDVSGPLREIFHRFGADQEDYELPATVVANRPEEYITELFLPVSGLSAEEG